MNKENGTTNNVSEYVQKSSLNNSEEAIENRDRDLQADLEEEHNERNEEREDEERRYNLRSRSSIQTASSSGDYVVYAEEIFQAVDTPETYQAALASDDHEKWIEAMNSELNSLKENETWELVELVGSRSCYSSLTGLSTLCRHFQRPL